MTLSIELSLVAIAIAVVSLAWTINRDIRARRSDAQRMAEARRREAEQEAAATAAVERQRRGAILNRLRAEWIASHDGITPGMMAGTEPLPKMWVESRLATLGETWRQSTYY